MHAIVFIINALAALTVLARTRAFLQDMRSRHPNTWEDLGEPSLGLTNNARSGLALLRFLWRRDYEALADPDFIKSAEMLRIYQISYFILFGAILLWFLAESFINARHHI